LETFLSQPTCKDTRRQVVHGPGVFSHEMTIDFQCKTLHSLDPSRSGTGMLAQFAPVTLTANAMNQLLTCIR